MKLMHIKLCLFSLLGGIFFLMNTCKFENKTSVLSFAFSEISPITNETNHPSLVISNTSLVLTEGNSKNYSISIDSSITESLTVNFHCSQNYITCPNSLQFDSSNWNIPQTISLSILHDAIITGVRSLIITHSFIYKGQTYTSSNLNLSILDIDTANIQFSPTSPSPQIKEGTVTDSYSIVLTSSPTADVTIQISYDSSKLLSINGNASGTYSLTFTSLNYNIPQTLTLSAPFDTGLGTRSVTLSHNVNSSDFNYHQFSIPNITVNIEENSGGSVGWGSFQSGTQNAGFTSTTIALPTSVNPSKTYVYCNFEYSSSIPSTVATCQLNGSGTGVILQTGGNPNAKVNWYVVEMQTGLKVERGSTTFVTSESTKTETLSSSFYTQSSFVILYTRTNDTNHTNDAERLVMGRLTNSTTLELTRLKSNTTGVNVTVEWQVVELSGAKVISGTVSLNNTQTSNSITLSENINLSKSFLIFNTASDLTNGEEQNYYVRGHFSASNSITFNRDGSNGKIDISYFAIEMVDSSTVQSGSGVAVGASSTSVNVSLSPSVVVNRSMIVMSYSTSGSDISYQDSGTFTASFNSSPTANQIIFQRYIHESHPCTINWYAIGFPP